MNNPISRRRFGAIVAAASLMSSPALAFSTGQAEAMIEQVVAEINRIINSGKSQSAMIRDFEKVFGRYADTGRIGMLVLGPPARSASAGQRTAFANAFRGYMAKKYGLRFREFIGGQVVVNSTKAVKSFYEVKTTAHLAGVAPFEVVFVVADENGLFIDMKIEGISLIKAERSEIGTMLDQRKGDLNRLIADLNSSN